MIYFQDAKAHFPSDKPFFIMKHERGTPLHFHNAVEFMFILSGELSVSLNGKSFLARKGDLVTVNSEVVHSATPTSDISYYILIAHDEFFKANGLYLSGTQFSPLIRSEEIQKIFGDIILEYEKSDGFSPVAITALCLSLFVTLNRHHAEKTGSENDFGDKQIETVKLALDYLKNNFNRKLTVDELSSVLNFSKSHLSHVFKKVTGHSIISYVNLLKCQNAKTLILNGATIKKASDECGFKDVSYFTRTYKKTMGSLPSEILK
ncbi:MAG: helix-turn-helix transcriptional regulator [Clostridia bacterium]|nr:helix-turn-helix transcriptional regulator [Clostridia bacterium]